MDAVLSRSTTKPFHGMVMPCHRRGSACFAAASGRRTLGLAWHPSASLVASLRERQPACPVPHAVPSSLSTKPRLTYVGQAVSGAGDGLSHDKTLYGSRIEEAAGGVLRPPPISRPDADFESQLGVQFVEGREGIVVTELNELFEKVGFPRRDPERLRVALENTYHIIWVRATRTTRLAKQGQMVGFARATSDGVLSATVWDVAVSPAWQRSGLGRALMERLTKKLVEDGIPTVTLYAEPQVVTMYEKLGYVRDPEGIRGMAFQRRRKEKAGGLLARVA
ncbi:hypothetical protein Agub_g8149 [Astrephomene gubernaculifera]|uniref:N-acetyltransferase domain-containing protein n=1 Tax=Astrephomene gubernaculifera TaxID=47775 RepID=A0AAD3DTV3_9CHLO|nr:hypothetical protein Agub_g8149 [Astrephomene gubernaculifera]